MEDRSNNPKQSCFKRLKKFCLRTITGPRVICEDWLIFFSLEDALNKVFSVPNRVYFSDVDGLKLAVDEAYRKGFEPRPSKITPIMAS